MSNAHSAALRCCDVPGGTYVPCDWCPARPHVTQVFYMSSGDECQATILRSLNGFGESAKLQSLRPRLLARRVRAIQAYRQRTTFRCGKSLNIKKQMGKSVVGFFI